jgi:alkylation response protein AidB-like acyl-CoA dehydrogenase
MGGISLLLLEKGMPGLKVRRMATQFDSCHNTTFITLDNVKVPTKNLIGGENAGFMMLMLNFNHERFVCLIVVY